MYSRGFTTVELMVTLFAAVLFLLSGYQLYDLVNSRSLRSSEMSEASNIAYEVLRKEGSEYSGISNSCTYPANQNISRPNLKLKNVSITLSRCKPFAGSSLIQVTSKIRYGNPQREVVHATYIAN